MKDLTGQKLYLDTNLFIYALEEIEPWVEITKYVLDAIDRGGCSAVTSELTVAECLVKPLELGRTDLVQTYLAFLQSRPSFSVVPVNREIFIQAARLRANARLKLPDAIHAATAIQFHCSAFITNNERFAAVPDLQLLRLKSLENSE